MKIYLLGEFSNASWKGSATQKVAVNLAYSFAANGHEVTCIEVLRGSKKQTFFGKCHTTYMNGYSVTSGGVIPLILSMLKKPSDIFFVNVIRTYQIVLFPFTFLISSKRTAVFHDIMDFKFKKEINTNSRISFFLKILYLKFYNSVFVLNSKDKTFLIDADYDGNKIHITENGIDPEKYFYDPDTNRTSGLILNSSGIGFWNKGLDFNEKALKKLAMQFEFQIIGKNPEKKNHSNYKGELNENEYIELIRQSRLVVISSYYDSFSLVGLEAMACGTPIIITENCGLAERLQNGNGCFIVKYNDEEMLAEKISVLLTNNELWVKMSADAIRVSQNFKWETVAREYESIFLKLKSNG